MALALAASSAALCFLGATAVAEAIDERLLAETAALHLEGDVMTSTGERAFAINGAELGFASGRSSLTLDVWLEASVLACKAGSDEALADRGSAEALVVRARSDSAALVGCVRLAHLPKNAADLTAMVRAFSKDLDIARFGALHVMRARRVGRALHVVHVRSVGSVPLAKMFPRTGDAPGFDLPGVARPAGARRELSSFERGAAPLLVSYARSGPLSSFLEDQENALSAAGYRALSATSETDTRVWSRGPELLLVRGRRIGDVVHVSLLALGQGPAAVSVDAAGLSR